MGELLSEFLGIECNHRNRRKLMGEGVTTRTMTIEGKKTETTSKVHLWYCEDCESKFYVDWGDISFKLVKETTNG